MSNPAAPVQKFWNYYSILWAMASRMKDDALEDPANLTGNHG